jgi:hypothetical protein
MDRHHRLRTDRIGQPNGVNQSIWRNSPAPKLKIKIWTGTGPGAMLNQCASSLYSQHGAAPRCFALTGFWNRADRYSQGVAAGAGDSMRPRGTWRALARRNGRSAMKCESAASRRDNHVSSRRQPRVSPRARIIWRMVGLLPRMLMQDPQTKVGAPRPRNDPFAGIHGSQTKARIE